MFVCNMFYLGINSYTLVILVLHMYHIILFAFQSYRKKLRTEVGKTFPALSQEDVNLLIPLKEEMTVMKIFTHGGQTVTVYNVHKNPILFEADRLLYPTGNKFHLLDY